MNKCKKVCEMLGNPYTTTIIDGEEVIYRKLNDAYDIEVSGNDPYTVFVWCLEGHKEIVGIYRGIRGLEVLKDTLGYCAFKFQNLHEKIHIESEETIK